MKHFSLLLLLCVGSVADDTGPAPYSSEEAWLQSVPRRYHSRAEFAYVTPDPSLANVLLIGDSLSMSYTQGVRERLADVANVFRAPNNCRSTRQTLAEIETYLGTVRWDVIHVNWGIHDITHLSEERKAVPPPEGQLQVGPDEYEANLHALCKRLRQTGADLIWASTTPIGSKAEAKGYRRDRDVVDYNAIAERVMRDYDIPTNDLYSLVKPRAEELLRDGVHVNPAGQSLLADAAAASIREQLLWFREDFTETPPEVPVQQKHLENESLVLKRLGPGGDQIKRSFHENVPNDPHYVWSGLCSKPWGIAFEHRSSAADLSRFGKVRWRTKQAGDRVLYVILQTKAGWLVSDAGTPASKGWTVNTLDLAACQWHRLDATGMIRGDRVDSPDLSRVQAVGGTDLTAGGASKACSRLDWIEVYGEPRKE